MKDLKKIIALVLVVIMALGVGSMAFADEPLPDIILDGGEEGGSPMIKTLDPPKKRGQATDDYKHQGFVSFLDLVPSDKTIAEGNYRYIVMTYTGDITKLRINFVHGAGTTEEELTPSFWWFDKENVTDEFGNIVSPTDVYFVSPDESDFPLVGDNTTIVIDLLKSGIDIDWYNSGLHMHCSEMLTYGNGEGIVISNAYLTTTLPTQQTTTEASSEATSTEASSTEAPSTAAATTEAATTAEATTEATTEAASALEAIILDGGEEGKSTMIKKFVNTKEIILDDQQQVIQDGYKYLGYVTFKDLANENYRYLALTYTGDITNLRLQFVHDAGGSNEEMGEVIWFDPTQENHFVTADGSDIPLVGNNSTIFIDLEASGAEMDWYNSGMHVHVSGVTEIDCTYAALLTELPKEDETLPIKDTVEGTTAAGAKPGTPVTGDVSPVVISLAVCLVSLVVLGGAVVVRRRY